MTERQALRKIIEDEMRLLNNPFAVRDSLAFAHDYARQGYGFSVESIQVIVREVARKLCFLGIY